MQVKLFLIPFLLLICFSCKKDKAHGPIQGQVIDATTGNAISGATVFIRRTNYDCFMCSPKIIATFQADANGKFAYLLEKEQGYSYDAVALAVNYFNSSATGDEVAVDYGKMVSINLQPKAWLNLHIKNTQPFNSLDYFAVAYSHFYGTTVDTNIILLSNGNSSNSITYWVTKNNIQTINHIQIYTPAFDTTNFTINY